MQPLCMSVCACMISWCKCMEGSDKNMCVVLAGVELESGVQLEHCLDSAVVRGTVSFLPQT